MFIYVYICLLYIYIYLNCLYHWSFPRVVPSKISKSLVQSLQGPPHWAYGIRWKIQLLSRWAIKKVTMFFSAQHCDLLLWIFFVFFAEFIAIKIAVDICWYLVGGWALPLWKMMEFVSRDDYYNLIPNCFWKVIIQPCSSHHQPVINHH